MFFGRKTKKVIFALIAKIKTMKKIILSLFLATILIAPTGAVRAQVATTTPAVDLQAQYQSLLLQLINLLLEQVKQLQAQLVRLQADQSAIKAAVVPPAAAVAPVPQANPVLPAEEYPVISFSVDGAAAENADLKPGEHKIEWLATQKNKNGMSCSSPEIGKVGTQGVTVRTLSAGTYSFTFSCVDLVTLVESSKILTLRVLQ